MGVIPRTADCSSKTSSDFFFHSRTWGGVGEGDEVRGGG
jgi:hypothetical protein